MNKQLALISGIICSFQVHAFTCFVTVIKDSCWTQYNVDVKITNSGTGKAITTSSIVAGKSWDRQKFSCDPEETLSLSATFNPVFWESDTGKVYAARHNWSLPQTINKDETAWNINVCYPKDFAEVPLPPQAGSDCKCDTDSIPPIKPQ